MSRGLGGASKSLTRSSVAVTVIIGIENSVRKPVIWQNTPGKHCRRVIELRLLSVACCRISSIFELAGREIPKICAD